MPVIIWLKMLIVRIVDNAYTCIQTWAFWKSGAGGTNYIVLGATKEQSCFSHDAPFSFIKPQATARQKLAGISGGHMAADYIITINRQFGSMGGPIAKQLSERLGINYYDREIVDKAARKLNMQVSEISSLEESAKGLLISKRYPLGMGTTEVQDKIFKEQKKIILNFADGQSCIFVGRCADDILKDHPHLIRIFIFAPKEERINRCVQLYQMPEEEARRMVPEVDKAREMYHKKYTGYIPGDPRFINLAVDSSVLGVDATVDLLEEYVRRYKAQKNLE